MQLIEISRKLNKYGYASYLHKEIGILFCGIEDKNGVTILDTTSQVSIEDNKIICSYFNHNLEIRNEFLNEDDLIKFIRTQFPTAR